MTHTDTDNAEVLDDRANAEYYVKRPNLTYALIDHVLEAFEIDDVLMPLKRGVRNIHKNIVYYEYTNMLFEMQACEKNPLHARAIFLANLYAKVKPVRDLMDDYIDENP